MGSDELAANLFRISLTNQKINNEKIKFLHERLETTADKIVSKPKQKINMKLFISFILLSFVLFVVVWIQPIRTIGGMEYIARKELWATMEEIHRNQGYAIVEDIKGPIITEHDSLSRY